MSDNAVAGRVVFGDEVDSTNFNVDDLSRVKAELKLNDKSLAAGESSEVLGNPLNSLQWLVKKSWLAKDSHYRLVSMYPVAPLCFHHI